MPIEKGTQSEVNKIMSGLYNKQEVEDMLLELAKRLDYSSTGDLLNALANFKQPTDASKARQNLQKNLRDRGGDNSWEIMHSRKIDWDE